MLWLTQEFYWQFPLTNAANRAAGVVIRLGMG